MEDVFLFVCEDCNEEFEVNLPLSRCPDCGYASLVEVDESVNVYR